VEPPQDARVGPANAAHPLRPPNFFAEKVAAWVRLAERAERADAPSGSCRRGIVEARQSRDRLAKLRDRLLRAVRSNPTRKLGARRIHCSVLPDCAFALGERAGFVTVERHSASEVGPIQRLQREEIGARAAHPSHIDLRAGDAASHLEPLSAAVRSCDSARQGGDLVRECGINAGRLKPCRTAFREERALPSGVLGPRLRRPFLRLASRLASLIMRVAAVRAAAHRAQARPLPPERWRIAVSGPEALDNLPARAEPRCDGFRRSPACDRAAPYP
jgi:hypothetical protein